MPRSVRNPAGARVFCYLLGPFAGAVMLHWRNYGHIWAIRFHAFHSMILTVLWALLWGALRGIEAIAPWFLAMLARQLRFTMNLAFALAWALLMITAYRGSRLVVVPSLHALAVRLSRRFEKPGREETAGGSTMEADDGESCDSGGRPRYGGYLQPGH
jgi:uncharacterized membrane protein